MNRQSRSEKHQSAAMILRIWCSIRIPTVFWCSCTLQWNHYCLPDICQGSRYSVGFILYEADQQKNCPCDSTLRDMNINYSHCKSCNPFLLRKKLDNAVWAMLSHRHGNRRHKIMHIFTLFTCSNLKALMITHTVK